MLIPIVVFPLMLVLIGVYPFLESWITGDKREHHLLDRPRDHPVRTGLGATWSSLYLVLLAGGGNDIVATQLHLLLLFCMKDAPGGHGPDGLACLAAALDLLDPGSAESLLMFRLCDEWRAARTLPAEFAESWALLADCLKALRLPDDERRRLLARATLSRLRTPPDHSTTPWSDFLYLVGQNTAPGQVPPWMAYLDEASAWMDAPHRQEIRAINRQRAVRWEFGETLDRRRYGRQAERQPAIHDEHLAIRIMPAPFDEGHYTVSYWFHSDARGPDFEGRDSAVIPFADLQRTVSEVISEVERAEGDRPGQLRLELVLPLELINLPVARVRRLDPSPVEQSIPKETSSRRCGRRGCAELSDSSTASRDVPTNAFLTHGLHGPGPVGSDVQRRLPAEAEGEADLGQLGSLPPLVLNGRSTPASSMSTAGRRATWPTWGSSSSERWDRRGSQDSTLADSAASRDSYMGPDRRDRGHLTQTPRRSAGARSPPPDCPPRTAAPLPPTPGARPGGGRRCAGC